MATLQITAFGWKPLRTWRIFGQWWVMSRYPLVNQDTYGKSAFAMGKSTISMAIFYSYISLREGNMK
jgi:hypothetical protein